MQRTLFLGFVIRLTISRILRLGAWALWGHTQYPVLLLASSRLPLREINPANEPFFMGCLLPGRRSKLSEALIMAL